MKKKSYTAIEVAQWVGSTRQRVVEAIKSGELEASKLPGGRKWNISEGAVQAWIKGERPSLKEKAERDQKPAVPKEKKTSHKKNVHPPLLAELFEVAWPCSCNGVPPYCVGYPLYPYPCPDCGLDGQATYVETFPQFDWGQLKEIRKLAQQRRQQTVNFWKTSRKGFFYSLRVYAIQKTGERKLVDQVDGM